MTARTKGPKVPFIASIERVDIRRFVVELNERRVTACHPVAQEVIVEQDGYVVMRSGSVSARTEG